MEYILLLPSWSWLNWLCIYKVIVPIIVGQLRIATVKYLKYFDSSCIHFSTSALLNLTIGF